MDAYQRHHVEQAFRRARLRAWISGVRGRWGRRLTELVSFPDVRARILVRGQRDLGLRLVALHQMGVKGGGEISTGSLRRAGQLHARVVSIAARS